MDAVLTLSGEVFIAIVFALINLQIQVRLMSRVWGRGCSWKQFLDIYDLKDKYQKWLFIDFASYLAIMVFSVMAIGSLGWATVLNPYVIGIIGVEALAMVLLPIRFFGARIAVSNNPNLLDFNGKYKGTHSEYRKLVVLLDEKKLSTYKKSVSRLWSELLLLNKRRKEAYASRERLEDIKKDVQKLITAYSLENDVDKRLKAQARLNKIIKQQEDIEVFTKHVEEQMTKSENAFMDIRTKLEVGQNDNILPDLSNYTNQIKSLELTVDSMDGGEIGVYGKHAKK